MFSCEHQKSTKYVNRISFVVSDGAVKGVANMVNVDMNAGSRGKYIYPVVHYTNNRSDAISAWYFVQNNKPAPSHYTKIYQDLNEGAGGTYNYLCYTKIGNVKVKDVTFIALDKAIESNWYNGYRVYRQDLNTGAKRVGKYIYLLYKTE